MISLPASNPHNVSDLCKYLFLYSSWSIHISNWHWSSYVFQYHMHCRKEGRSDLINRGKSMRGGHILFHGSRVLTQQWPWHLRNNVGVSVQQCQRRLSYEVGGSMLQHGQLVHSSVIGSMLHFWWLYEAKTADPVQQHQRISRYVTILVAHTQQCLSADICYNVDGLCMEKKSAALYGNVSFASALVDYMQRLWHRVQRCLPPALYQYIKMIK